MRERKGCLQACTCATTAALHAGHMLCQPAAHEQRPAPPRCFGHMLVSEAATSACAAPASGGAQMARSLHQSSRGRRPGDVVGYGRLRPRRASSRAARVRPRRRRRSVSQTRLIGAFREVRVLSRARVRGCPAEAADHHCRHEERALDRPGAPVSRSAHHTSTAVGERQFELREQSELQFVELKRLERGLG